jgi:hypothetical protein
MEGLGTFVHSNLACLGLLSLVIGSGKEAMIDP